MKSFFRNSIWTVAAMLSGALLVHGVFVGGGYAVKTIAQSGGVQNLRASLVVFGGNAFSYLAKPFRQEISYTNEVIVSSEPVSEFEPETLMYFVGDIMLDRGVRSSVNRNGKGNYDYFFTKTDFFHKADIVFGNLEGPVSSRGRDLHNLYSFRMATTVVPTLKKAGFSVLSIANNHIGDWGRVAFEDTLIHLFDEKITAVGGGLDRSQAETPKIVEHEGVKVGFLAFSDVGPKSLEVSDDDSGILLASDPNFSTIIRDASANCDFFVVSFHFGDEYKLHPNARQKKLAHAAIDAGAGLVVGHHPHVVEDVEVYKNAVIAYSLGNFIFDQSFSRDTMRGMMLAVRLKGKSLRSYATSTTLLDSTFRPSLVE